MRKFTSLLCVIGASTLAVCVASADTGQPALPAASAPLQVKSAPLEIKSAPLQLGFAPPRAAPSAAVSPAAAQQPAQVTVDGKRQIAVNGQTLTCRDDVATGSHTERHSVCLTQAQLQAEQLKAQRYIQDAQKAGALSARPLSVGGMAPQ
jgi:hypothetical protein